ncbi:MAG: hypothetical protein IPH80_33370 [Myxococcales bacterium]|nr:hypothetical protein [Myxococcales bacterium]
MTAAKGAAIAPAAAYLAELRSRVEALGIGVVAAAAGLTRQTVWRTLGAGFGRSAGLDTVDRLRRAVTALEARAGAAAPAPLPPPAVAIQSRLHHAWIALADQLEPNDIATAAADPRRLIAAIRRRARR